MFIKVILKQLEAGRKKLFQTIHFGMVHGTCIAFQGVILFYRNSGRPPKTVSKERLENVLKLKLPVSKIAELLEVSRPCIYKAIRTYGLNYSRYSSVNADELQQTVSQIKSNHLNAGEVMVQGHLKAQGFYVQHQRVRNAIHRIDPNVSARKRPPINRRVYSVPCPNYLWHIDGNHKMIRWRFVIHHGIDGFSRLVTFCQCSGNNKATTVYPLFQDAVAKYGKPIHVRTDYSGENVLIWRNMTEFWGEEAHSVIVGSSVHNQRIERHNRAVNEQVVASYKAEFYALESEGILDPLNSTDLFCLHYTYLPRIRKTLCEFVAAHNNHRVSTEENKTPTQLFWLNIRLAEIHSGNRTGTVPNHSAVDVHDLLSSDIPHVQVPDIENPLSGNEFTELQRNIDPLSGDDGKDIYRRVVQFVGRKMLPE